LKFIPALAGKTENNIKNNTIPNKGYLFIFFDLNTM